MSYDLAVWIGPRPASAEDAEDEYTRRSDLMMEHLDDEEGPEPAPQLLAFVEAALARYPALDENSGPECPWASAPLSDEIHGEFIYFPLTFSGAAYARDVLAEIADAQGLVCFDPQVQAMLPDPSATPASVISDWAAGASPAPARREAQPAKRSWLRRMFGG